MLFFLLCDCVCSWTISILLFLDKCRECCWGTDIGLQLSARSVCFYSVLLHILVHYFVFIIYFCQLRSKLTQINWQIVMTKIRPSERGICSWSTLFAFRTGFYCKQWNIKSSHALLVDKTTYLRIAKAAFGGRLSDKYRFVIGLFIYFKPSVGLIIT